eukprot:6129290-Pyramimonas_sp.AAC.1
MTLKGKVSLKCGWDTFFHVYGRQVVCSADLLWTATPEYTRTVMQNKARSQGHECPNLHSPPLLNCLAPYEK